MLSGSIEKGHKEADPVIVIGPTIGLPISPGNWVALTHRLFIMLKDMLED